MEIKEINQIEINNPNFNYLSHRTKVFNVPVSMNLITATTGVTGSGKTSCCVFCGVNDGSFRGQKVYSNMPIHIPILDANRKLWLYRAEDFNSMDFIMNPMKYYGSRLILSEANFDADRLRSTSNKSLSLMDLIQQSRKLHISAHVDTIAADWLNPRLTGYLLDVLIKTTDLFFTEYGRRHHIQKGVRTVWQLWDVSGKLTGKNRYMGQRPFWNQGVWAWFDSEHFVDPLEARRGFQINKKRTIINNGEEVDYYEFTDSVKQGIKELINKGITRIRQADLLNQFHIGDEPHVRQTLGRLMRGWNVVYHSIGHGGQGGIEYDFEGINI